MGAPTAVNKPQNFPWVAKKVAGGVEHNQPVSMPADIEQAQREQLLKHIVRMFGKWDVKQLNLMSRELQPPDQPVGETDSSIVYKRWDTRRYDEFHDPTEPINSLVSGRQYPTPMPNPLGYIDDILIRQQRMHR